MGAAPIIHTHTAAQGNQDIVAGGYGQVGTYGFLVLTTESGQDVTVGEVYPGSSLGWGSAAGGSYGSPTSTPLRMTVTMM